MATVKGIGFYSVKTGETRYAKSEAQIQGYLNSSDMGINASRGQDYGWRLEPDWVKKVKAFRRNDVKMSLLTARNSGRTPTQVQILYAIYAEQLRKSRESAADNAAPYEEKYLRDISTSNKKEQ